MPDAAIERIPVGYGDIGMLCSMVEACVGVADRSRADMLYAKLEPYAGLNAVGIACEYKGSAAHYVGLLASLREQPAAAALRGGDRVEREVGAEGAGGTRAGPAEACLGSLCSGVGVWRDARPAAEGSCECCGVGEPEALGNARNAAGSVEPCQRALFSDVVD